MGECGWVGGCVFVCVGVRHTHPPIHTHTHVHTQASGLQWIMSDVRCPPWTEAALDSDDVMRDVKSYVMGRQLAVTSNTAQVARAGGASVVSESQGPTTSVVSVHDASLPDAMGVCVCVCGWVCVLCAGVCVGG